MKKGNHTNKPYQPNFIHYIYDFLDRLPIPEWLTLIFLLIAIGVAQHFVAWRRELLAAGQFNFDLGTAGIYLSFLFLGIYVIKGASQALDDFRPLLNTTSEEYENLKYRFVTIPRLPGNIIFLIGAAGGVPLGLADMEIAPAVDYAFAELRISIWMLGGAVFLLLTYQVVRQLRQIARFYAIPERIDIFNQRPLYGFSRYTATLALLNFILFGVQAFDPTAFAAFTRQAVIIYYLAFLVPILLVFYLPLSGVHLRLVSEKDLLLGEVSERIETILVRIEEAAFDKEDYAEIGGMRSVYATMKEKKETIEGISTWPWRPGTFSKLLSALLLPIILTLLSDLITGLLNL